MKIGIEGQKMPRAQALGPMKSLDHVRSFGMSGIFFNSVLDMSPTLDRGLLREIRQKADALGMYLEAGLGKINPYASAEAPELRAIGDGDIVAGLTRMMEAAADIGCFELWVSTGNFKPAYRGRLALDRFRTDVTWADQLAAIQKLLLILAPVARDLGIHMNIETHDEITSFEAVRLVETVGPDVMGIVYDMANPLQRGEHPVHTARRVAPYVRQTHVKDVYVAHAEGGLDFQPRACGEGMIDFRTILPILWAANPNINLTIENVQSTEDKPRDPGHPRQCIQIYDKAWIDGHPDLSLQEYADYLREVHLFEKRISSGEIASWETFETVNFGYPAYRDQPYGYDQTLAFIETCRTYLEETCTELDLPVERSD